MAEMTIPTILVSNNTKYQYNNVMALLKNYDQMMKNLNTVRNSNGWADTQVALQYETVSRQVQALKADLQQLIITLDEAGANNGLASLVKGIRSVIQSLQQINPETIKFAGYATGVVIAIKSFSMAVSVAINFLKSFKLQTSILSGALNGCKENILSRTTALKLFSAASMGVVSNLLTLIPLLIALNGIWESVYKSRNAGYFDKQEEESIERQTEGYQKFIAVYKNYQAVLNDSSSSEKDKTNAMKDMAEASRKLKEVIGEEAYARIKASDNIVDAIDKELGALKVKQDRINKTIIANKEKYVEETEALAQETMKRIRLYETELSAQHELVKIKQDSLNGLGDGFIDTIASKILGNQIDNDKAQISETEKYLQEEKKQLETYYNDIVKAKVRIVELKRSITQPDILGGTGGTVEETTGDKDNATKTSTDFTEKAMRNQYERERNQLWYEGNIAAKQYENALKEITNTEQAYGASVESILGKADIYSERLNQLTEYQAKLEKFKQTLIADLDSKMANNPELAAQVNYMQNATVEEKLKNIEINKELYQQLKTYSSIVNMISSVNQKLEETKGKAADIALQQLRISEELFNQRVRDIQTDSNIEQANIDRPNSWNKDNELLRAQLNEAYLLREAHENRIRELEKQLNNEEIINDAIEFAGLQQKLKQEEQEYADLNKKIAELENQKNLQVRQGLASITQQLLVEGNSWRNIWDNLWQDLAREAINQIFRVQGQVSILGAIMRMFGLGGSTMSFGVKNGVQGQFAGNGDFISNTPVPKNAHIGSNIMNYPKMHTGGAVEQGRLGVVPKLKSDEVIRTLQVGEEVNSLQDRRSNEILAAVAMKAIDERSQQPQNINIMAMDSKSFAEFLNYNADILLGVLNKQGALGRR